MNDPAFSALPALTQAALAEISDAVEGVLPVEIRSWPIDATDLPDEAAVSSLIQGVSGWAGASKACLHYFECQSADIDLARVEDAFLKARARRRWRRLPQCSWTRTRPGHERRGQV